MSRTLTFVSLLALGTALVGGALAQTATDSATTDTTTQKHYGQKAGLRFEALDTNKDGNLEKSEVKGRLAKVFDEIDSNKDGKVTKDELKAGWQAQRADRQAKMLARKLASIDTDKDGKVSWAETEAKAKARFDKADANHDGFLDTAELSQGRHGWRHHRQGTAPQQGR